MLAHGVSAPTMLDFVKAVEALGAERMYLTAPVWAAFAAEVAETTGQHPQPTPDNFQALRFGKLLVLNSGTESEDVCDEMNRPYAEACGFAWKRDHWRVA